MGSGEFGRLVLRVAMYLLGAAIPLTLCTGVVYLTIAVSGVGESTELWECVLLGFGVWILAGLLLNAAVRFKRRSRTEIPGRNG